MKFAHSLMICISSLFLVSTATAQCAPGGIFDPSNGICHYSNGYQLPGTNNTRQNIRDYWGAIAIDPTGEKVAASVNLTSRRAAQNQALEQCGSKGNCHIIFTFKNSCAALATDGKGVNRAASGATARQAENKALRACHQESGTSCRLWIRTRCTSEN